MPSSIVPIQQTRGYAVRPAAGLRFGNFEGVVHLPPLKSGPGLGERSYSTLNNQQIYRTVCEWAQSWQPWQQKVLLYSIANRCTLPQLEILATTLEPLRHRDPLRASRSKPLTAQSSPSLNSSPPLRPSPTKVPYIGTPQQSNVRRSRESPKKNGTENGQEERAMEKSQENETKKPENINEDQGTTEQSTPALNLDQYASLVSSSVLVAAMGEVVLSGKIDKILEREFTQTELKLNADENAEKVASDSSEDINLKNNVVSNDVLRETSKLSSAVVVVHDSQASQNVRPGILRSSSGKRADRSRNTSAQFLGGRISFTPVSRQSRRSEGSRSGSSRYRFSAFASSAVSTPDYFLREKIPMLGRPQRKMRTGKVQKPRGLGNVPVPMQQFYKNRGWWPQDLPDNMHLKSAHKRELSNNFRDQLAAIYEWLQQWESYERLSLLKEVVKQCSADVLEASVNYIHQKLQDVRDMNRLPDKLLLYILSCLPPSDILNATQVCRRWHYLCAVDDLWIVKCLELGEEEGIENIPQLIDSANTSRMGVDWMLAYMELRNLVRTMNEAQERYSAETDFLSTRQLTGSDDAARRGMSKRFRIRRRKDKREDGDSETSELAGRDKLVRIKGERGEATGDNNSQADSGMSEEDLSALLGEEDDQFHPEFSGKGPGWSKSQRKSLLANVQHRIDDALSERSSEGRAERSSKAGAGRKSRVKEEEEEDTALDIHTDLSQSKDLLGKVVPAMSLEWQTPEHDDDFIRYPMYAGKVASVQKVRKIQGHIGGIQCLQFDRRRLVTGGSDRCLRLWDVRSGRSVHKFYGHKGGVRCLKFDDDILVSGSWDSVIFVWNIRRFTKTALLHGHDDSVSCLELTKHYILSGSHDCTVRVWARPTYMCCHELKGHSGPVLGLVADDEHVYSTAADMTIRMTDVLTGMCERVFERANHSPVNCLFMHGELLMGGDGEGKVYFWNTATGEAEAAVKVHEAAIHTIHYHNGRFYTGSSDGTMTEYDLMTMTCLRVLRGHKGPVRALQVSDRRFVSCSDDGSVRIWDLHTDKTTSLSSVF
ncbi:uncharacterized protein [Littorina saxatilis]|uniref:F-box domain-containing protein n=1 Tax=Littorina saxatilis TaxID=31220 RepID=A0AAN9BFR6_9CAEN